MQFRASWIIATIALLICFICPILETFDNWDPPIQTGNDTEYTLVIVALCTGAAYSCARFILKLSSFGFMAQRMVFSRAQQTCVAHAPRSFGSLLFDAASPPLAPIRI
jgi:hypothetical protein